MKSSILSFGFPVPLTSKVWVSVQKYIHPQLDTENTQQEFRKRLALYAVDFYLQCMAFQVNPEASDSNDPILSRLLESNDLMVQDFGKLECCPVLAGETSFQVPIDAQDNRLAYIVVQLEEHYKQAQILGFTPQPLSADGEIDLCQIQPIDELPQYLYDCKTTAIQKVWAWVQDYRQQLVTLAEPISTTFFGWELPQNLSLGYMRFEGNDTSEPEQKSVASDSEDPVVVSKVVEFQDLELQLILHLSPKDEGSFRIELMVEPVIEQRLPNSLQIAVLDQEGQIFHQLSPSNNGSDLVTRPFSAAPSEHFSIELLYDGAKHTENFVM